MECQRKRFLVLQFPSNVRKIYSQKYGESLWPRLHLANAKLLTHIRAVRWEAVLNYNVQNFLAKLCNLPRGFSRFPLIPFLCSLIRLKKQGCASKPKTVSQFKQIARPLILGVATDLNFLILFEPSLDQDWKFQDYWAPLEMHFAIK